MLYRCLRISECHDESVDENNSSGENNSFHPSAEHGDDDTHKRVIRGRRITHVGTPHVRRYVRCGRRTIGTYYTKMGCRRYNNK